MSCGQKDSMDAGTKKAKRLAWMALITSLCALIIIRKREKKQ